MTRIYRTKCRTYILEYFQLHKEQRVNASDIFTYLEKNNKKVDLATIYRNLEKMTESGTLLKYKTADGESCLYQYVEPHANCMEHLHMQCRNCGKIIHLECDFMNEITNHLFKNHGFLLECKNSVLFGLCENCR